MSSSEQGVPKVLLVGSLGSGKSSLVKAITDKTPKSSVGITVNHIKIRSKLIDISPATSIHHQPYWSKSIEDQHGIGLDKPPAKSFSLWEIPEQEFMTGALRKQVLDRVHGVFVVVDRSLIESLEFADKWSERIRSMYYGKDEEEDSERRKNELGIPPCFLISIKNEASNLLLSSSQMEKFCQSSPVFNQYFKLDVGSEKSITVFMVSVLSLIFAYKAKIENSVKATNSVNSRKSSQERIEPMCLFPKTLDSIPSKNQTPSFQYDSCKMTWNDFVNQYFEELQGLEVTLEDLLSESSLINPQDFKEIMQEFQNDLKTIDAISNSKPCVLFREFLGQKINYWNQIVNSFKQSAS